LFLGGNFIEIGVTTMGNFGTSSKPANFYGWSQPGIGMSVDYDGYNCGSSHPIDFFLPGTPEERFSVGLTISGTNSVASLSARNVSNFSGQLSSTTKTITNTSSGNTLSATVVNTFRNSSSEAIMEVTQEISFGVNDKFFTNSVKIKNVSGATWSSTRYMRSFDPDNTAALSGGSYTTQNEVLAQQPADGKAVVRARTVSNDSSAIPSTYDTLAPILFYSSDATARASSWGFDNRTPYASQAWDSPVPGKNSVVVRDEAINIAFEQGSLAPNATTQFSYVTSLDERDFNQIAAELEIAQQAASNSGAPSITSIAGGTGSLAVSFNPPSSDGGSPITSYEYSLDGSSSWVSVPLADISSNSFTISSLTNATTYAVRIRAVNAIGPSAASSPTNGTPFTVPGAPTISAATSSIGSSTVSTGFGTTTGALGWVSTFCGVAFLASWVGCFCGSVLTTGAA
jgi:hypothetical protein